MRRMRRRAPYERDVADNSTGTESLTARSWAAVSGMVDALHPERRRSRPRSHGDATRREPTAGGVGRRFAPPGEKRLRRGAPPSTAQQGKATADHPDIRSRDPSPARKRSPRGAARRRRGVGPGHTLSAARPGGTGPLRTDRLRHKPHTTTIRRRRDRMPSRAGQRRHVNWSGRTRCLRAKPDAVAPATVRAFRSSGRRRPTHTGRVSTLPGASVGSAIAKPTSRLRRNRESQIKGSNGRWVTRNAYDPPP